MIIRHCSIGKLIDTEVHLQGTSDRQLDQS